MELSLKIFIRFCKEKGLANSILFDKIKNNCYTPFEYTFVYLKNDINIDNITSEWVFLINKLVDKYYNEFIKKNKEEFKVIINIFKNKINSNSYLDKERKFYIFNGTKIKCFDLKTFDAFILMNDYFTDYIIKGYFTDHIHNSNNSLIKRMNEFNTNLFKYIRQYINI